MVRQTELAAARRGAARKLASRRQGARSFLVTAVFVGLDPEDGERALVRLDEVADPVTVVAPPVKMIPGSLVAVAVDTGGRPVRILGPVSVRPEGLDEDAELPAPVTPMPGLASFSPEDQAKVDQAVDDIGEAQDTLEWASPMLDLLSDLGAETSDPVKFASALTEYLQIPLDQIKIVDNRGADGDVIVQLYDALIVERLLLAQEIITDTMLAKKSVTAPALNVVHVDPTTGYGFRLDPEGFTLLDQDGAPFIVMRSDMANAFTVMKDGKAVASISPDGEIVGRVMSANESLQYRTRELQDILDERGRGPVTYTEMSAPAIVGTAPARLVMATIETPTVPRAYKLTFGFHRQGNERMQMTFRQSIGTTVSNGNSVQKYWYVAKTPASTADYVEITHTIPDTVVAWGAGNTVTFGFFAQSLVTGETATFDPNHGVTMLVEDIGPAIEVVSSVPYVPSTGGGGGQGSDGGTTVKKYKTTWDSIGHRTYSTTGLSHVRAGQSLVQGSIAGANSRGHWIFPNTIQAALTGATVSSGTLTIRNEHTYGANGMTAVLRTHGYTSAPGTFGTSAAWTTVHVPRGGTVSIPISAAIVNGIRNGDIKGFSLDATGTTGGTGTGFYGYFSPDCSLTINYTK